MPQELIYTSTTSGLKSGSKGFCTVAATNGLPPRTLSLLESLSGYRHTHPPGQSPHPGNPTIYSHLKTSTGESLLSRVGDAGLDYSGRSNKLAHHLLLSPSDLDASGPAAALAAPGNLVDRWDEPAKFLPPRSLAPGIPTLPPCNTWQSITGDAAWAATLAGEAMASTSRDTYVVFDASMPCLRLIEEALSLLPSQQRWNVTFSTFFNGLPPGMQCGWRFVLKGSREHQAVPPHNRVLKIDLTQPGQLPPENRLFAYARTGQAPATAQPTMPTRSGTIDSAAARPSGRPPTLTQSGRDLGGAVDSDLMASGLPPITTANVSSAASRPPTVTSSNRGGIPIWLIAAAAMLLVVLLAGGAILLFQAGRKSANKVAEASNNESVQQPPEDTQDPTPTEQPESPDPPPVAPDSEPNQTTESMPAEPSNTEDAASAGNEPSEPGTEATGPMTVDVDSEANPNPNDEPPAVKEPNTQDVDKPDPIPKKRKREAPKPKPVEQAELQYLLSTTDWLGLKREQDGWRKDKDDRVVAFSHGKPEMVVFMELADDMSFRYRGDIGYEADTGVLEEENSDPLAGGNTPWAQFIGSELRLEPSYAQRLRGGLLVAKSAQGFRVLALHGSSVNGQAIGQSSQPVTIPVSLNRTAFHDLSEIHPGLLERAKIRWERSIKDRWSPLDAEQRISVAYEFPPPPDDGNDSPLPTRFPSLQSPKMLSLAVELERSMNGNESIARLNVEPKVVPPNAGFAGKSGGGPSWLNQLPSKQLNMLVYADLKLGERTIEIPLSRFVLELKR